MFLHLSLSVSILGLVQSLGLGQEDHWWRTTFISSDINPDHQLAEIKLVLYFYNLEIFLLASYLLLSTSRRVCWIVIRFGKTFYQFHLWSWEVQKDFPQTSCNTCSYLISPHSSPHSSRPGMKDISICSTSPGLSLHDLRLSEAAQWEIKVFLEAILIPGWIAHRTT